ncbi:hypothetical protein BU24DRAFT_230920 [Aaosphaeria arxii CBS 175.79]|uniref:Meiotically up-regulated protein Msb1/Mug8 domain-containing protein n=1 Tax=Aaosphaeria arxii CBS 175.79 TaxID=1450172 RepID=A0A6A5XJW5_9PLEO|nr:uncharacterized protein BU24DRAFT_230920 [Aaosphaeria arxii CBS 175.79]KAF2013131.1 hypothetical protein BU24DRAFT_230920 [Aaosphaeria arxii CBS 175.79]
MPFFKNVFKSKDGPRSASKGGKYTEQSGPVPPPKPRWEDAWSRKDVAPEEVQELVHGCTQEMKSRALDMPFLLLPFRPASDHSAARNFVRSYFRAAYEGTGQFTGESLQQELRLAEPLVLCSIIKWCWSRLPGGVVTWDVYELFRVGESDSNFARHAYDTFIPLSVDSDARKQIVFNFFDLLAAVAARGKTNGMGGRKLSRMAGWWAFTINDDGKGFDGGYRSWERAADAASHLFFAYLRSLSPDAASIGGISSLPRSLQALVSQTEYPPQAPLLMQTTTTKVVMIVDSVSPTPFALLRRAKNFEYRDDDEALQRFSAYEDSVQALTDECRRVLERISSTNQSIASPDGAKQDASWSRFEDLGFSGLLDSPVSTTTNGTPNTTSPKEFSALRSGPRTRNTDFGRPTTPSWADFLSSGFADENGNASPAPLLLPPDKVLPPIGEGQRVHSSQSHLRPGLLAEEELEPGELASITQFDLDDTFWWVWMTSLADEETVERKAAFGRCTLIETRISGAKWLVMEEQVKGASPGPEEGAYIAEKKGRFSFTRRGRLGRRKSTGKKPATVKDPYSRVTSAAPMSKTSIGPDQHARIQAAAARLAQTERDLKASEETAQRRARMDDAASTKTNSVLTLQPHLLSEAGPAMKWDKKFGEGAKDRDVLRAQYLGDVTAGKGSRDNLLSTANGGSPTLHRDLSNRDLPSLPKSEADEPQTKQKSSPPSPLPPVSPAPAAVPHLGESSSGSHSAPDRNKALPSDALDEKPAVQPEQLDTHPAFRKPVPDRKPVQASEKGAAHGDEDAPLPEVGKKSPPKKLKKNAAGGGFRKLFGKKKADASGSTEANQPAPRASADEAFVEPERSASYVPQQTSQPRDRSPAYVAEPVEPTAALSPAVEPKPTASVNSHSAVSIPAPQEHSAPDPSFSRFDQGPMDDMPAFVPDDTDDEVESIPPAAPAYTSQPPQSVDPEATSHRHDEPTMDDLSEASVDLSQQAVPSQDRWAQIRKNAAERAARLSEEQSRRSHSQSVRTDEGETSGEETIESRVARIKARVAQLTGNMEGQGQQPPPPGMR